MPRHSKLCGLASNISFGFNPNQTYGQRLILLTNLTNLKDRKNQVTIWGKGVSNQRTRQTELTIKSVDFAKPIKAT